MRRFRFSIIVLCFVLGACAGDRSSSPVAPAANATRGFQYEFVSATTDGAAVSSVVVYAAYCDETSTISKAAPIRRELGPTPEGEWANMGFPHDGIWYCGVTARSTDMNESNVSATALGVRKDGDVYYRL